MPRRARWTRSDEHAAPAPPDAAGAAARVPRVLPRVHVPTPRLPPDVTHAAHSVSIRSVETWAHGLADALDQGLCAQVGVSNYNSDQVARTVKVLKERGHRLASNQIEFSLLKRRPETSGLLQKCADMGVAVMAYSPLAMGRLTGKSFKGAETKERVFASGGYSSEQYDALIGKLRQVGEAHGGATPAQIALAWTIAKGTVPIAGAKTARPSRRARTRRRRRSF